MPTNGVAEYRSKPKAMKMLVNRWQDINWATAKENVFKWQRIIYAASKKGDIKTVRKCQHRILESWEGKLLAIRRVTQENKGKKTADKVKSISPEKISLLALAKRLVFPTKASPLRKVWIPTPGTTEKRLLGIPTIKDRCLQALFKLALEPEWEAKFEHDSYGFRPGRNCHDAVSAIRSFIQKRPKYLLDADITKCFDRIDHQYLLNKIGMKGKYRTQLKYWLESGVLETDGFSETIMGTPLGGIISPLLANIALHGMEEFCKNLIRDIPVRGSTGKLVMPNRRLSMLGFIRYADDFVVIHPDLSIILLIKEKLPEYLTKIGLELSPSKTHISHTLEIDNETITKCPGLDGKPGFNFLGFYIRQYKTKHLSAKSPSSKKLGFRTLIIPNKEKRKEHQKDLHKIILKQGKHFNQDILIKKLNPVIRGWANYFGKSDANTCGYMSKMEYLMYLKLRKWAKRVYKTTGKGRAAFRKVGNRNWAFSKKNSVLVLQSQYSTPLNEYVKVAGEASPF
uniref:Reverse transcriptase domain-containing protein n=1 Tax=Microglena monadina TaxID=47904 RepID=A0A0S2IBN3_9CHLO|nr:hypothetical protein [Microglena monadina]